MFSFRTTPLAQQSDIVLSKGRIGVLCNQVAFNPELGEYLFETLYRKGNLRKVFTTSEETGAYSSLGLKGCSFYSFGGFDEESLSSQAEQLADIDALIIELQDTGSRYCSVPSLIFNLFQTLHYNDINISVYILDRENPAGRSVEGTAMAPELASSLGVEGLPHRHGLTLGEMSNLFHSEIGAKFPLHIISYLVRSATQFMMPWSIPPTEDIAGMFTCNFLSGQYLWEVTNVSSGRGTTRPFEMFGAPFMESLGDYNQKHGFSNWNDPEGPLYDPGVFIRWTSFIPCYGSYAGRNCFGFQLLPNPGVQYHALAHQLRIMRFVALNCPQFSLDKERASSLFGDPVLEEYAIKGGEWDAVKEHIKLEEQKWIRKAKRYQLYDDSLWRVKSII